jgi:DNA-binding GntR family transcriptional regulator
VRLKAERFVTFEPNKGYRVAARPDSIELEHLFQARLILETGAVREGLGNVDEAVLTALTEVNAQLTRIGVGGSASANRAFVLANERFHLLLIGLSRNPFVIDAYNRLGYHQRMLQTHYERGDPDAERVIREHDEIILALRTRKPGPVEKALRDHIIFGRGRLLDPEAG